MSTAVAAEAKAEIAVERVAAVEKKLAEANAALEAGYANIERRVGQLGELTEKDRQAMEKQKANFLSAMKILYPDCFPPSNV
jgi:hypothetical protein